MKKMTTQLREQLSQGLVVGVGCWDAYSARMAEHAGFKAVHLSGYAHEVTRIGRPDLGIQTLTELAMTTERMADTVNIPILVDIDTGYGGVLNVRRTIRDMERAGAAGVHIEDQILPKRCPSMGRCATLDTDEAINRVKAALDARTDPDFVIAARTDLDGTFDEMVERCNRFLEAGADMVIPDYLHLKNRKPFFQSEPDEQMELLREFAAAIDGPVMGLGTQPPKGYTVKDIEKAGFRFTMFAANAFYASSQAIYEMMRCIVKTGNVDEYTEKHHGIFFDDMETMRLVHLDDCDDFARKHTKL